MLELKVHDGEQEVVLQFEHSLRSLSKWEQKHKKAFMSTRMKEHSEMIDYFQDMLLSGDPTNVYRLSPDQLDDLAKYINDPMTASSVPPDSDAKQGRPAVVTTELVYAWMTMLKINWDAQDWHYNRLIMLIQIINFEQKPQKKRTTSERIRDWREVQAYNKEHFGIEG